MSGELDEQKVPAVPRELHLTGVSDAVPSRRRIGSGRDHGHREPVIDAGDREASRLKIMLQRDPHPLGSVLCHGRPPARARVHGEEPHAGAVGDEGDRTGFVDLPGPIKRAHPTSSILTGPTRTLQGERSLPAPICLLPLVARRRADVPTLPRGEVGTWGRGDVGRRVAVDLFARACHGYPEAAGVGGQGTVGARCPTQEGAEMRAVQVREPGGPQALTVVEIPEAEPGPGQVRIRVAAAGVNFIDVYHRTGAYPLALPFVPGLEAAGTVEAVGPEVTAFAVGDRVAHGFAPGAYAQTQVVDAAKLVALPDAVALETAAALMLQGMTAHYLVASTFPLAQGQTALVHAAAGGVGLLLTQLAVLRGARVLATTSTEAKAELARGAGADAVIRYDEVDVADAVAELTDGAGVDVVYDSVGRATFDASLASLRPRGMLVLFGQSSGPVEPVDPQRLNAGGSLFLTRPTIAHYLQTRAELTWRAGELLELVAQGRLDVRIGETHPLEEAPTAHARLEARATTGKVLLLPG